MIQSPVPCCGLTQAILLKIDPICLDSEEPIEPFNFEQGPIDNYLFSNQRIARISIVTHHANEGRLVLFASALSGC